MEFFAGGGMARAGLGASWRCILANDNCGKKALVYQDNWGLGGELIVSDVAELAAVECRSEIDLAWASFPCQDLSLAGAGGGLTARRSSTFFSFWNALNGMFRSVAKPKLVVIENVSGLLNSKSGADFKLLVGEFIKNGYFVGGIIVDASMFVPQSRKRIFVIGFRKDLMLDPCLVATTPYGQYHPKSLVKAVNNLPESMKADWVWLNVAPPKLRTTTLSDIVENDELVCWNTEDVTQALLNSMSEVNRMKVQAALNSAARSVGTIFKRTRIESGVRVVRAEVRFDDIAGCLRTPNGGSSRQTLLVVDNKIVRTRLLTPRETARLMGLSDGYRLPKNANAAYHLTGDGVVVPVVTFLKDRVFEPFIQSNRQFRFVSISESVAGKMRI
ncbi:MAG: DNA (cytosine-5-)-methyltransferase [Pseudomonadota bacterium]